MELTRGGIGRGGGMMGSRGGGGGVLNLLLRTLGT